MFTHASYSNELLLGLLIIEPKPLRASRASLQVAKEIIEIVPRQPYYVITDKLVRKTGIRTKAYDHNTNTRMTITCDSNQGYSLRD